MHDAVGAYAIQQELQSDATAETDVRGLAAARSLRGFNGGGDRPLIARLRARATSGLKIP